MSDPPIIGPSLPLRLLAAREEDESHVDKAPVGPQLPPTRESATPSSKASYGPSLPPGMMYGPSVPETTQMTSKNIFRFVVYVWYAHASHNY